MFLPSRKYVGAVVLSVLSGVLLALSIPGPLLDNGLGFIVPLALFPLFVAIEILPTQAATNLKPYMRVTRMTPAGRGLMAFALVWLTGSTFFGAAFSWTVVPILRIFRVAHPSAYLLHFAYCMVCGLVFTVLFSPFILNSARAVRKFAEPFPLWTMIIVTTAIEVWMPRQWPWTLGGFVQGSSALNQWISIFGASALTPLVLATSASLARSVAGVGGGSIRFVLTSGVAAFVWLFVWALGAWRHEVLSTRVSELKKSEIVAVQPSFLSASHFRFELPSRAGNLEKLIVISQDALAERVAAGAKPDLVVWPEGVLPEDFSTKPEGLAAVRAFTAKSGVPVLFSAFEFDATEVAQRGFERASALNSAFLVRADGSKSESYSQSRLVPFLDAAPFKGSFPFVYEQLREMFPVRQVSEKPTYLSVPYSPDFRVSSLISFDVASWKLVQKVVSRAEVGLFVHLANGVYTSGTQAMLLMQEMAHLRAIESGRSVVSVSNVEAPVAFDPLGRSISPAALRKGEWSSFVVPVFDSESHRSTFYTDFGNFPLAVATAIALLALAIFSFRRAR